MALYGESRDISMFRRINRELMQDIISEQVVFYKYKVTETKVNMYGEAVEGRNFIDPILLYALVDKTSTTSPVSDLGVDFIWNITFRFLRDDLVDSNVHPEVGDVLFYQNGYWEIDNTNITQFFVGKDPNYPYLDADGNNPYETDLGSFGYNVSVICECHYVPSDRLNIQKSRL